MSDAGETASGADLEAANDAGALDMPFRELRGQAPLHSVISWASPTL